MFNLIYHKISNWIAFCITLHADERIQEIKEKKSFSMLACLSNVGRLAIWHPWRSCSPSGANTKSIVYFSFCFVFLSFECVSLFGHFRFYSQKILRGKRERERARRMKFKKGRTHNSIRIHIEIEWRFYEVSRISFWSQID